MIDLIFTGKKTKGETVFHLFDIYADKDPVGECNLRVGGDSFYSGNIGYRINEEYRCRGYATTAVLKLKDIAKSFGVSELYICTSPDNIPSRRVAEKLGASYLGDLALPESHELYAYGRRAVSKYVLKI